MARQIPAVHRRHVKRRQRLQTWCRTSCRNVPEAFQTLHRRRLAVRSMNCPPKYIRSPKPISLPAAPGHVGGRSRCATRLPDAPDNCPAAATHLLHPRRSCDSQVLQEGCAGTSSPRRQPGAPPSERQADPPCDGWRGQPQTNTARPWPAKRPRNRETNHREECDSGADPHGLAERKQIRAIPAVQPLRRIPFQQPPVREQHSSRRARHRVQAVPRLIR